MKIKSVWIFAICWQLTLGNITAAQAQLSSNSNAYLEYLDKNSGPSDYTIKRFPNQKLMPTRLIGGVYKPGFYQVPENTSLLSLMSYSGGVLPNSDLSSVTIWRQQSKESLNINLDKILKDPASAETIIMPNDVIYIKEKEKLISSDTMSLFLITSTTIAIILGGLAVHDRTK